MKRIEYLFKKIILLFIVWITSNYNSIAQAIIFTSDQQLTDLTDPNKKIDMSLGHTKRYASLRDVCEEIRKNGGHTLTIAFDEFFRQYRDQPASERKLTRS
ncbi:hypothetical protein [Arenibacter latericius]|uniref:hypothetical protein n=1 Tax=Arenibacter latericius TaxID=86104 RepID=UPI00047AD8AB|nr:hypothetical protein [Arenibacter latericius]